MMYAVQPIVETTNGYMIAETDKKLLKSVNLQGMQTVPLGESVNYLASETIPIYCSSFGLQPFFERNKHLLSNEYTL